MVSGGGCVVRGQMDLLLNLKIQVSKTVGEGGAFTIAPKIQSGGSIKGISELFCY